MMCQSSVLSHTTSFSLALFLSHWPFVSSWNTQYIMLLVWVPVYSCSLGLKFVSLLFVCFDFFVMDIHIFQVLLP